MYSAVGQNLKTSDFEGEIIFAIIICISGLVLFALLIGNMQVTTLSEHQAKHFLLFFVNYPFIKSTLVENRVVSKNNFILSNPI